MSGQNNKQQFNKPQQQRVQNQQQPKKVVEETVTSEETVAASAVVVESKEEATSIEVSGASTRHGDEQLPTSLEAHERLDLRTFTEHLDKYIDRYKKKAVFQAEDVDAHRSLIVAIRMMLSFNEKVLREAFADIIGRMSAEQPGDCFTLPTLVKHLHTDDIIQSSTERVFMAEFLVLLQRFAMLDDKTAIRKRVNFQEVFGTISDKKVRDRLENLFPKV